MTKAFRMTKALVAGGGTTEVVPFPNQNLRRGLRPRPFKATAPAKWRQLQDEQRYRALLEGLDRGVFLHVEDGVELGNLQQVVDFLGEVSSFRLAALVLPWWCRRSPVRQIPELSM